MEIGNEFEIAAVGANPDRLKYPVTVDLFNHRSLAYTLNLTTEAAEKLRDALDDALNDCTEAEDFREPDPDEAYERWRDEQVHGF